VNSAASSDALRVLVIDDDDISRETLVALLRDAGHHATSLPSPIGATKHIVSAEIQVVVLDVMMPSMRGDKLAALLFKNPKLKNLGVVLVTGAPATELATLASEVKAAAIVSKSSIDEDLVPAVRRAVRRG
jgi:CheY-like chemotaxis protein